MQLQRSGIRPEGGGCLSCDQTEGATKMATPGKEPEGRLIYSCRESQRKTVKAPWNDYDGVVWEQQRVRCKFASDAYSWEQLSKLRALDK